MLRGHRRHTHYRSKTRVEGRSSSPRSSSIRPSPYEICNTDRFAIFDDEPHSPRRRRGRGGRISGEACGRLGSRCGLGRLKGGRKNTIKEIVTGIFTWSWYSEPHGYNFNGHLLRHPAGNICIDPVQPGDTVLDELVNIDAARIVITNRNHSRAANLVRARPVARTAIHADDPVRLRQSVRALLDLNFKILLVGDGVSILSAAKDRLRELTCRFPD